MRVWSRGLGRVELAADLNKVKTVFDGKSFYIVGRTEPPIGWDFIVRLSPSEMQSMVKLMMTRHIGRFLRRFLGLRTMRAGKLAEEFKEATTTRTGVRPDQEYAELLALAPPKQAAAQRSSTRRRSLMPRRSEKAGEPDAAEAARLRAMRAGKLAEDVKDATATRTGVRPDRVVAEHPKQTAAQLSSARRRSVMPRRAEKEGEPNASEAVSHSEPVNAPAFRVESMHRHFARCPACAWESPLADNPFEVDRVMALHVRTDHPKWPSGTTFRREIAE